MNRFQSAFLLLIAGVFVSAFSASGKKKMSFKGYEKADNGSWFKLIEKGTGTTAVDSGGAVFIKIKFVTEQDSEFLDINASTQRPSYPMRVEPAHYKGDFLDLFTRLHAGDSARLFLDLVMLKKSFPNEFEFQDPRYDNMKYLGMAVRVDSIYSREKVMILKRAEDSLRAIENEKMQRVQQVMGPVQEKAKEREPFLKENNEKLLNEYLNKNNISARPDANGIYFFTLKEGIGEALQSGQVVAVRYTGTYLDGTVFDSNEMVEGQEPMYFRLGIDPMIPGFTDCLLRMRMGERAKFIVPPAMAYNDSLSRIFEVEVVVLNKQ